MEKGKGEHGRPGRKRGLGASTATTVILGGYSAAGVTAPIITGSLATKYGWRGGEVVAIQVLCLWLLAFFRRCCISEHLSEMQQETLRRKMGPRKATKEKGCCQRVCLLTRRSRSYKFERLPRKALPRLHSTPRTMLRLVLGAL